MPEELGPEAKRAQAEFAVILDLLLAPPDLRFERRRWRGGCLLKLPDLVPSFTQNGNTLKVTVTNHGDAPAPASTTRVNFRVANTIVRSVDNDTVINPPPPSVTFEVAIPQADSFEVIADFKKTVDESDETNNTITGNISGPVVL